MSRGYKTYSLVGIIFCIGCIGAFLSLRQQNMNNTSLLTPLSPSPVVQKETNSPREKPDSSSPAAGICEDAASSSLATIILNEDTPQPRCLKVTSTQYLHVINKTSHAVSLTLGRIRLTIPALHSQTAKTMFGTYLYPGVHRVKTSLYGESGPQVWLP